MRYIALPEFRPGLDIEVLPPSSYLEKTNGTLRADNCRLITDENGFLVSERPLGAGDRKIILLSNSTIENLYVPLDQRVASRLEFMAEMHASPVKVYNGAISNANTLCLINILLNKGIALRPDCVIYYPPCGFDMTANALDNSFWNESLTPVKSNGQQISQPSLTRWPDKDGYKDTERLLHILCAICKNFGIALFMATWPLYGDYDAALQKIIPDIDMFHSGDARMRELNLLIRRVAALNGVSLIDLEQGFAKLDHGCYFYDWNHPNAEGCELIAAQTAAVLFPAL